MVDGHDVTLDAARVITLPEVRQRLEELAYEVVGGSPEQFAELMRADTAQSAKVIAGAGIRPD